LTQLVRDKSFIRKPQPAIESRELEHGIPGISNFNYQTSSFAQQKDLQMNKRSSDFLPDFEVPKKIKKFMSMKPVLAPSNQIDANKNSIITFEDFYPKVDKAFNDQSASIGQERKN